jgi:two-component system, OmpR family, KDP operon response regulator KdpE
VKNGSPIAMKHRALRVIILDNEPAARKLLRTVLTAQGYNVMEAADGNSALQVLRRLPAMDVFLLELELPDRDGFGIIKELRTSGSRMPIIVLSNRGDEDAKVEALDLGADDYLTKPFGAQELCARIRASRRRRNAAPEVLRSGELTVNLVDHAVWLSEEKIHLSPTEYALLIFLMRNAGEVLTNSHIANVVWGEGVDARNVRVFIRSLRQKLQDAAKNSRYIATKLGGYQFCHPMTDGELSAGTKDSKSSLKLGNIELATEDGTSRLLIDGYPYVLPSTKLLILKILLQHEGRAVPKMSIADYIASGDSRVSGNSIEVYVHRLRRQLKGHGAKVAIDTVKGVGYLISARPMRGIHRRDNTALRAESPP